MRRHSRGGGDEEDPTVVDADELNLVPYLDIITALVIFLIFTFQVVIEFRLIELLPPAYGQGGSNSTDEPKLTVTLLITKEGYRLVASDEKVIPPTDIPRLGAVYDTQKLTETLLKWKEEFKLTNSIILIAEDETEYQTVVEAMDAVRTYEKDWLFPDVLLATPVAGGG